MPDFKNVADRVSQEAEELHERISLHADFAGKERRSSERRVYPTIQIIAPFDGVCPPTKEKFCNVCCHDISDGGLSFFWPTPPEFECAVIGLGTAPQITYLEARVVHHTPIDGLEDGFLIGCELLGQITVS